MKIGIIIITYNIDARIFLLQIETIKKFCTDGNYTIEIIDNSSDREKGEAIKHHAKSQEVNYRRTQSNNGDASWSHSFAANFSYQMLQDEYEMFFYLDHDCIPVKKFSVEAILGDKIVAGVESGQYTRYFWPGCLIFNNTLIDRRLINFSPNGKMRMDTGGELYKIIEIYGRDRCLFFDEVGHGNPSFNNTPLYYFYMMIYNETFLHFLNSSNWNKTERNEERLNSLINITTNKIEENNEEST